MNPWLAPTPTGMTRRHFMNHLAGSSAAMAASSMMGSAIAANASDMRRKQKSAILLWMGGGPATIDIWDLKPGAPTGGPFRPITTTGEGQICEHMPMMAQQMHNASIVRSMSTREADHTRGRYYMHTGFVPNPNIEHPSYGSVISHELIDQRSGLEIPPFVAVGGAGGGPGFLGMAWSPFSVTSNGQIRNMQNGMKGDQLRRRYAALQAIESGFQKRTGDSAAVEHGKVLEKTFALMTSSQMEAFRVEQEPDAMKERYGENSFGQGCLLARRLVEAGVPFVEVSLGGWDNHQNIHTTLADNKLPQLDRAMSALYEDLESRGMLEDTVIIWMGEFGRTPRINENAGRDHFARAWSCVVGGGKIQGGKVVGETSDDGMEVVSESFSSEDLMTTVCKGLDISTDKTFTSNNGRPMKIAGGGRLIEDLLA